MNGERHVHTGHDAHGNVIVTGSTCFRASPS
jgi:hypothetical protein